MPDVFDTLRAAVPSAVVGGVVWLVFAVATGSEPDFLQGALFVLAFGVVSAVGYLYSRE
ncbi:hypothetical protein [Salinigranum rubrum]|jgi:hypothetical protein|uniref:hypothetical protein n=1 Tax=Salinigranum rubrum TaxID=755307 RepID=UPI00156DCA0D|nr:hypothetical protein [Salinigranum rubrum]